MVSRHYLLKQTAAPSEVKRFFDQQVIPASINLAGMVEGLMERLATDVRAKPIAALGAMMGMMVLIGMRPWRRR